MNLTQEITRLRQAHNAFGEVITTLQLLVGVSGSSGITSRHAGRTTGASGTTAVLNMPSAGKRRLSVAGRRKIAAAQKARWAKNEAAKKAA